MIDSLRNVSKKRMKLNRERAKFVRRVLTEVPYCEAHLEGCTNRSADVHELLTRARGGSIVDRENVVALCRRCHSFITTHPEWSRLNGWMLSSWDLQIDKDLAAQKRRQFLIADTTVGASEEEADSVA